MEDANRGTGRTTLMLFDAYMAARSGKTVYVLFPTDGLARNAQRMFSDLFSKNGKGPSSTDYACVSHKRGSCKFVYFRSVHTNPGPGMAGVVLADHTVREMFLVGDYPTDEIIENLRAWKRIPEGRNRT